MQKQLWWLPAIALMAGCGGGGSNPAPRPIPTAADLPPEARYPAYRAVSEEGNELFLQVREDAGEFKGRYAFFYKEEGSSTDIMEGPVQGSVAADGTIRMTLRNPYDEAAAPIEIEGRREGENLVMADAENPEDVETFEPLTAEEAPTSRVFGGVAEIRLAGSDYTKGQTFRVYMSPVPIWVLPFTWLGSGVVPENTSINALFTEDESISCKMESWGNNWTKVTVTDMRKGNSTFIGWLNRNYLQIGDAEVEFDSAKIQPYQIQKQNQWLDIKAWNHKTNWF